MMLFGQTRHIYFSDRIPVIDVFYDQLNIDHRVSYKGQLELHPHCVSPTDLLPAAPIGKSQIGEMGTPSQSGPQEAVAQ